MALDYFNYKGITSVIASTEATDEAASLVFIAHALAKLFQ